MKLTYIGTGAADWTKASGARDGITRRFTCTLVDRELLIDLAPTTPASMFVEGGVLGRVTDILYTHSHDDHYDSDTLLSFAAHHPVRVWVDSDFADRIPHAAGVEVHSLTPLVPVTIGCYTVTPLRANHRLGAYPREQALHYIISDGEKKIFWGADGAWLLTDTWHAIRANKPYDRMVLDGTLGEVTGDPRVFEHNSLPMIREMAASFHEAGCLKQTGQIWLTHLARDAHESPATLPATLAKDNLFVAFDDREDHF